MSSWRFAAAAWCLGTVGATALTAQNSITLHLKGAGKPRYLQARFRCDAAGATLGLPVGVFTVRYMQAGESSLAILPVHGKDLIFAQLLSADGSRYGAGRFIWWDARTPTFSDGDGSDSKVSTCKVVP